ncbi:MULTISPECIES: protein-L-isoaspartate O-methyltransferase [Rhodopseudomonas]|uniref:Protein-L-isoaspartate O-methyltransferase n=1 Tax=Rhodopseudomonas palustris TaxID=1076 RepID=A0A0D7EG78_RHOPL|nr:MULTISPECIES: protein-L-isoaspartate O-methyltransferase [Rhodopseudomonas]KIZ39530.1 protein-L-isoaspartate O-methyltransferase [Rhodopseudomonas palustris]MDF3813690.1 protein-L-isoaspartate O-methyltransferase [Rhodopseudomonas sp. BAL398]WOK18820.1 protein-L-isoaspartate O-methyltransferase [Rhodopseudomonas sp. BAL398]
MSDFVTARHNMVDGQIRPSSVTDWRIIDAMRSVPREAFVSESQRALAYLDIDIEVGGNGAVKQYLIQPVVTARLLHAAEITSSDHVLVVGSATGYVAALAAKLAGRVTASVSDAATAAQATAILDGLGFGNITVRTAPAAAGCPEDAPFDVIILNGATEIVPTNLYQQLKMGGRLVGVFAMQRPQRAKIVTRSAGDFGDRVLFETSLPVLPELQRMPAFVF